MPDKDLILMADIKEVWERVKEYYRIIKDLRQGDDVVDELEQKNLEIEQLKARLKKALAELRDCRNARNTS